jgi:hypothetical protein
MMRRKVVTRQEARTHQEVPRRRGRTGGSPILRPAVSTLPPPRPRRGTVPPRRDLIDSAVCARPLRRRKHGVILCKKFRQMPGLNWTGPRTGAPSHDPAVKKTAENARNDITRHSRVSENPGGFKGLWISAYRFDAVGVTIFGACGVLPQPAKSTHGSVSEHAPPPRVDGSRHGAHEIDPAPLGAGSES